MGGASPGIYMSIIINKAKLKGVKARMNYQRGLTLIEVLATSAILGIVITSFLGFTGYIGMNNQNMDTSNEALKIAEEQLNLSKRDIYLKRLPVLNQIISNYQVKQQLYPLGTIPTSSFTAKKRISLQSVIPIVVVNGAAPVPYILLVTVEWE
jgi:prepilin-type N-terminal cleavage/methylation domain-containing protein